MIASIYLPTLLGGLLAAWIGLLMWISNVKQRKAREAAKNDRSDDERD